MSKFSRLNMFLVFIFTISIGFPNIGNASQTWDLGGGFETEASTDKQAPQKGGDKEATDNSSAKWNLGADFGLTPSDYEEGSLEQSRLEEGQSYLDDVGSIAADVEEASDEAIAEADNALETAQPPSPSAAVAYQEYLKDQKRQEELSQSKKEVLEGLFSSAYSKGLDQDTIQSFVDKNAELDEYSNKKFVVFISSSMPDHIIDNFLSVLGNNPHTVFVMRGVIGNDVSKIMPTQAWVKARLCPNGDDAEYCYEAPIDINPNLYSRFNITHVPAVAYIPNGELFLSSCDSEQDIDAVMNDEDFFVYYGDFSPYTAFKEFQKHRPNDVELEKLIKALFPQGLEVLGSPKKDEGAKG